MTKAKANHANGPTNSGAVDRVSQHHLLTEWAAKLRTLIFDLGLAESLVPILDRASVQLKRQTFKLVVVGEFARGKSTLLNRLLAREVLPVGDIPTTSRTTYIQWGDPEKIEVESESGGFVEEKLTLDAWQAIQSGTKANSSTCARVRIRSKWLRDNNLMLVDTPGVNDIGGPKFQQVIEEIASADAVLVAVSAMMALSSTEIAFMEEQLLNKALPKVVVVLTRLDQVASGERERVIRFVAEKLQGRFPNIPLACFQAEGHEKVAIHSLNAMKRAIRTWVAEADLNATRDRQYLRLLREILEVTAHHLVEMKQMFQVDEGQQEQKKKEALRSLDFDKLVWEDIRLELQKRAAVLLKEIERLYLTEGSDLQERIRLEIQNAGSPRKWTRDVLPYLIRRELTVIGKKAEALLVATVKSDIDWVLLQAKDAIPIKADLCIQVTEDMAFGKEGAPDLTDLPSLQNVDSKRLASQMVIGGMTFIGFLMFGPVAMAAGPLGVIAAELSFRGTLQDQKNALMTFIGQKTPEWLELSRLETGRRLSAFYDHMVSDLSRQEDLWLRERQKSIELENEKPGGNTQKLANAELRILELKKAMASLQEI